MGPEDPTAVAREVVEAFNVADVDRFRAVLADGVVYEESGTGRRVEGTDAYVRLCQGWRQAFPDVAGTVRRVATGGDTAAADVVWGGGATRGRWRRRAGRFRPPAGGSRSRQRSG